MTSPALPPADSQFSASWHAQAFALCLALYEAGIFEWSEFSDALGVELATSAVATDDEYYQCYIDALTRLLGTKQHLDQPQLNQMIARWRHAYLSTAHGSPVTI